MYAWVGRSAHDFITLTNSSLLSFVFAAKNFVTKDLARLKKLFSFCYYKNMNVEDSNESSDSGDVMSQTESENDDKVSSARLRVPFNEKIYNGFMLEEDKPSADGQKV